MSNPPNDAAHTRPFTRSQLTVLDYVRNLPDHLRLEYRLPDLDRELYELQQQGFIITSRESDHSGFTWTRLSIAQSLKQKVEETLNTSYYPTLTDQLFVQRIKELWESDREGCMQALSRLRQSGSEINSEDGSIKDDFLRRLNVLELGYYAKYSEPRSDHRRGYMEFHFRKVPIDCAKLFIDTVEELVQAAMKELSDEEAWVLYLRSSLGKLNPDIVRSNTRSFIPAEVLRALEKVGGLPVHRSAGIRIKEELSDCFSTLSRKDDNLVLCLGGLLRASTATGTNFVVSQDKVVTLSRLDSDLQDYIRILTSYGLLLKVENGYMITDSVKQVLKDRLTGIYNRVYSVDTQLKATDTLLSLLSEPKLVKLWDPWIDAKTLIRIEECCRRNATIKILGSLFQDPYSNTDPTRIKSDLGRIRERKGLQISIRMIRYPDKQHTWRAYFHDRFIILPNASFELGSSINSIGKKPSWILELRRDWGLKVDIEFDYYYEREARLLMSQYKGVQILDLK